MIAEALPPSVRYSPYTMTNILAAILSGDLRVWGKYWPDEPDGKLHAVLTTTERYDPISGQRSILIYTLYGTMPLTDMKLWESAIRTLLEYTKSRKAQALTAYTSNRKLAAIIRRLGGDTDFTFMELNLD